MPIAQDQLLREVLGLSPVAIVGCSRTPGKAAHEVPKYLLHRGFDIIPINPFADEIFGLQAYPDLMAVDEDIALVNVFRPSHDVPEIVDDAISRADVSAIWLQLGISHREATQRAEDAAIVVVEDLCIKIEYDRLVRAQ